MHADVDGLSAARDDFRLTISTTKTEVMLQLTPGKSGEPHIQVKGCNFKAAKILPIPLQHSKYWCGQHAHIWRIGDPPPKKKSPTKPSLKTLTSILPTGLILEQHFHTETSCMWDQTSVLSCQLNSPPSHVCSTRGRGIIRHLWIHPHQHQTLNFLPTGIHQR